MSIFSRSKRILGLDITSDTIRYVEVLKKGTTARLISYGEERVPDVEPRNALLSTLREIKRKTKTRDTFISLPNEITRFEIVHIPDVSSMDVLSQITFRLTEDRIFTYGETVLSYEKIESINNQISYKVLICSSDNAAFFKSVFVHAGINVKGFMSHKDALFASCIRKGALVSVLVLNMEPSSTDIAIFYPFNQTKEISLEIPKEDIPRAVKEVYFNFYKENNEKIGYVFASGSLAKDTNFLNYISRETRLPIEEVDVFTNVTLQEHEVPMIPKKESFLYAIALGLAIR